MHVVPDCAWHRSGTVEPAPESMDSAASHLPTQCVGDRFRRPTRESKSLVAQRVNQVSDSRRAVPKQVLGDCIAELNPAQQSRIRHAPTVARRYDIEWFVPTRERRALEMVVVPPSKRQCRSWVPSATMSRVGRHQKRWVRGGHRPTKGAAPNRDYVGLTRPACSTDSSWASSSAKVNVPVGRSFLPSRYSRLTAARMPSAIESRVCEETSMARSRGLVM
jgi:hypothetical protein